MYPLKRKNGLIVEEVVGETVIYDEVSHRAHCLNQTAALVWQQCDGETSVGEIAGRLAATLHSPADTEIVRLALRQLQDLGLLEAGTTRGFLPTSRRKLIQGMTLAGGAAAILPAITSIVAPTPAMARSGDYHGGDGGGQGNAWGKSRGGKGWGRGSRGRGHKGGHGRQGQ